LEEGFRLANCTGHSEEAAREDECIVQHMCPIKGPIAELHRRMLELLQGVTVAELFQPTLNATTFQPVLATLNLREACVASV